MGEISALFKSSGNMLLLSAWALKSIKVNNNSSTHILLFLVIHYHALINLEFTEYVYM